MAQVASDGSASHTYDADLSAAVNTYRHRQSSRDELMKYIVLIAVIGVLLLQLTGSIPLSSVGGPLVIGLVLIVAALAVGIHEAWTKKRGVLGWIVNIVVSFFGAFLAAQLGGLVMVMMVLPFMGGSASLAAAGDPLMSVALAGQTVITLLGSWGAVWVVNRWR